MSVVVQVDLDLPINQILGLFNRIMRKLVQVFTKIEEDVASASLATPTDIDLQPINESIDVELVSWCGNHMYNYSCTYMCTVNAQSKAASKFKNEQSKLKQELMETDLSQ